MRGKKEEKRLRLTCAVREQMPRFEPLDELDYSLSFSSSPAMQPWQHFWGLPLSGQSSESSIGHVRQSHLDLSVGQVNVCFLFISIQTIISLLS